MPILSNYAYMVSLLNYLPDSLSRVIDYLAVSEKNTFVVVEVGSLQLPQN